MAQPVLHTVRFKLRTEDNRDDFLSLTKTMKSWLHTQPGFIRYELIELEDGWMDTLLWQSDAAAQAGNAKFAEQPMALAFTHLVDQNYKSWMGKLVAL